MITLNDMKNFSDLKINSIFLRMCQALNKGDNFSAGNYYMELMNIIEFVNDSGLCHYNVSIVNMAYDMVRG